MVGYHCTHSLVDLQGGGAVRGTIAKTSLDQSHQRVLISDLFDVFLSTIKFCHPNKVIRVVWIFGVDLYSFSRERPLSTQYMYHHYTIREDVNLENVLS